MERKLLGLPRIELENPVSGGGRSIDRPRIRRDITLDMDHLIPRQPHDIDRKAHPFHPEGISAWTIEGKQHPDRDAQFRHINQRVNAFQRAEQPAISVDTKKKEPLGKMRNPGRTYRRKGNPEKVKTHDFPDKTLGKAVPYGVYDLTYNEAGVSVGISHDTAEFAVAAIQRWWVRLGQERYPRATRLLITADSGGSNSPRTRLWRWALQQLANETGMTIELCHYPPGTSKWNKIEHRLFCHITRNWQGVPLETLEIVVNLIGSTRTKEGLEVHAWLDEQHYQKAKTIPDTELSEVRIRRDSFHGEWNYKILPNTK